MKKFVSYTAARLSIAYLIVTALWIYLSDHALSVVVSDPVLLTDLQSAKGFAFVLVMSLVKPCKTRLTQRTGIASSERPASDMLPACTLAGGTSGLSN